MLWCICLSRSEFLCFAPWPFYRSWGGCFAGLVLPPNSKRRRPPSFGQSRWTPLRHGLSELPPWHHLRHGGHRRLYINRFPLAGSAIRTTQAARRNRRTRRPRCWPQLPYGSHRFLYISWRPPCGRGPNKHLNGRNSANCRRSNFKEYGKIHTPLSLHNLPTAMFWACCRPPLTT